MNEIQHTSFKVDKFLLRSLLVMGAVVEARDAYTGGHLWRVSQFGRLLAEKTGLSRYEVFLATTGGFLHDLGKVGIPDAILNKPDRLTDEEYAVIKTHPGIGRDLLEQHPLAPIGLDAVAYHHERPDGQGYPYSLCGDEIPLISRIIGVVDAFDAMTSTRPYRQGMPVRKALNILCDEKGQQFDSMLVDNFLAIAAIGQLDAIIAHSFHERPLVDCPMCGPAMIVINAQTVDGGMHYCRSCGGEFRLHRSGDHFVAEHTGKRGLADQLRPRADTDPIDALLGEKPGVPQPLSQPAPQEPVSEPIAAPSKCEARSIPRLVSPGSQWVMVVQTDPEQATLWCDSLIAEEIKAAILPADSDPEINLRILVAENNAPALVLIDTTYFLTHHSNPYAFAGRVAQWLPDTRVILTNSAATHIAESIRNQSIRRGAVDMLSALPTNRSDAAASLKVVQEALRLPPPAIEDKNGDSEIEDDGLIASMANMAIAMRGESGISIKKRSYHFKTYQQCFVGSRAVQWLQDNQGLDLEQALGLGYSLVERGVFHHVTDDHDFKNENLFYRFIVDEILMDK